jgi:hypothetical protein
MTSTQISTGRGRNSALERQNGIINKKYRIPLPYAKGRALLEF